MADPTEHWLPVASFDGFYADLYEVSDLGRVRSLPRQTKRGIRGGKILAGHIRDDGYPEVSLSRENQIRARMVHLIVLETFVEPCPPGLEARHGPGGKLDASLTNLCWGTRAQNVGPDRLRDGQDNRGERHGLSKLTTEQVEDIRRRASAGETQQSIGDRYSITFQNVSMIVLGKTWSYPGAEPLPEGQTRHRRGADNPQAKLTESDVRDIRRRYATGESQQSLAQRFGVNAANISMIVNRKTWKTC